jgi:hypothetical protein
MDKQISQFYRNHPDQPSEGHFHNVIPLHQSSDLRWKDVENMLPHLCKGWYELSRLPQKDRVEFVKEYWMVKMPFQPRFEAPLEKFFNSIDDIGVFLVQKDIDDPYVAHMVYGLKGQRGFFRGFCGASDETIVRLKRDFPEIIFPEDYLAFLQIHDGFSKTTDSGLFLAEEMRAHMDQFQALVASHEGVITTADELPIDPQNLIPFYASFGMPFFQCFWHDWYPESEMGNVYYSETSNTISILASKVASAENMAFPTFMDWLLFYLESIE